MPDAPIFFTVFYYPSSSFCAELPTIEEKTATMKKFPGYLPFYWDENTGKVWFEIENLEKELLYVMSLPGGLGSNDIGLDRAF